MVLSIFEQYESQRSLLRIVKPGTKWKTKGADFFNEELVIISNEEVARNGIDIYLDGSMVAARVTRTSYSYYNKNPIVTRTREYIINNYEPADV